MPPIAVDESSGASSKQIGPILIRLIGRLTAEQDEKTKFFRRSVAAVVLTGLMLLIGLIWVWIAAKDNREIGTLASMAIAAVGGGFGFLFGIPRSSSSDDLNSRPSTGGGRTTARPRNASLEQVADWFDQNSSGRRSNSIGGTEAACLADGIPSCCLYRTAEY